MWGSIIRSERPPDRGQILRPELCSPIARVLRSLRLLVCDPEVLLFAAIAAAAAVGPAGCAVMRVAADPDVLKRPLPPVLNSPLAPLAAGLLMLLPCVVIGSLMNAAIVGCLAKRLEGGKPTIGDGLRTIRDNLTSIIEIILLTFAGVSVLAFLSEFAGRGEEKRGSAPLSVRALIGGSGELLFSGSALVLCVMIIERCGFREALRRAHAVGARFSDILAYGFSASFAVAILPLLWTIPVAVFMDKPWFLSLTTAQATTLIAGVPALLLLLSAVVFSALNLAYICGVYLAATRREPAVRAGVAAFFPDVAAEVSGSRSGPRA